VANFNDATVTIFTNNGSGIFQSNATYSVGSYGAFQIAAADLNGDGKTDLIVPGYFTNTITVLTNSGGALHFNATYTVGNGPAFVAVADLNGDGWPDVVVANYYDSSVTVYTNSPGGILHSNATYSGLSGAQALAIADVNEDGKPDLIVGNFQSDTLSVLTNDGSGGFALATTLPTGMGTTFVVAADLNGDGRVDLVSAEEYEFSVDVYLSQVGVNILRSGPAALVTWPANATNWTLLQNTNLTTTNWTAFPASKIGLLGALKTATNNPPAGNNFFRLYHP
jgi:hypothetical protein